MDWQTLAELARECAALPKAGFKTRFPAPFLLEVDSELGGEIAVGETRDFDPQAIEAGGLVPSLTKSRIVNFGEGDSFTIGRAEGSDIRCPHETVSDQHCKFESFGSIWAVLDMESKNGTFLNGKRMGSGDQSPLKFGTKLILGEAQFLFLSTDEAFNLIQDLSKEPRIRPRSLGKYRTDFKEAGDADAVRKEFPGPFLVVQAPKGREAVKAGAVSSNTITLSQDELKKGVNKNVTDAVFNLGQHQLVRIGRATVTQIHLPLGAISNLHAALVRGDNGSWSVQDLGAKNGTFLWGDRLNGKADLESGTELTFGNIKSIFFSTEDLLTYALHRDTLV
jgi:pSer/pThr/pTyr-binding forkhead associated (FHA) protein